MNIEDLKKVSKIRESILMLIHTTEIGDDIIESMLLPIECFLSENGVNLTERDF